MLRQGYIVSAVQASRIGLACSLCMLLGLLMGCRQASPEGVESDVAGFDFVVLADTAYTVPDDYPAYYQLIDAVNAANPVFSIHLGDTKSGASDCGDAAQQQIKADFQRFEHPLVYTPGDNEWVDCHIEPAGSYQPEERLNYLRQLFFSQPQSLGQQPMALTQQLTPGVPENALWWQGDVLFATLHVVGSNNGLLNPDNQTDESHSQSEYHRRNDANLNWLQTIFDEAAAKQASALVLAYHANLFFTPPGTDGYHDLREQIQALGHRFGRPVLIVHGDHHQFVIDRPYGQAAGNITRLQTFGWPDAKAVKIHVDTGTEAVFSYTPIYAGTGLYTPSSHAH